MYIASRPKDSREAWCIDCSSQGATSGAFHPAIADSIRTLTAAPYGGSRSSARRTTSDARAASSVGGSRNESFSVVEGLSTFPALRLSGNPSAPVTLSVGRHVLFSNSS
jgi:hypothetical protein